MKKNKEEIFKTLTVVLLLDQIVKLIIMLATGNSVDACDEEDCCHEK